MPSDVGLIAQAVTEIAKIVAEFQKTKQVRHMKLAIEYAERFILESDKLEPDNKLLKKYRKRFFKYN